MKTWDFQLIRRKTTGAIAFIEGFVLGCFSCLGFGLFAGCVWIRRGLSYKGRFRRVF